MNIPFFDLKAQHIQIKEEIDLAIKKVFDSGEFIAASAVKEFEQNFCKYYGTKYFVPVANGTDALYISLKVLGIGIGDEVITSACSWISTSSAISQTGAKPVFVDINKDFLIDEQQIESKITTKTKAIIPVHLYGKMADVETIRKICQKHNLHLIEDCAQAHLAEFDTKKAGLIGTTGAFSFFPTKNLGAYGHAGGITTQDENIYLKLKIFAQNGALIKHEHQIEGMNSTMDEIQGAILNTKLSFLDTWTNQRIDHAALYNTLLSDIKQLNCPKTSINTRDVFHLYVIDCERRNKLKFFLKQKGIETAIHYPCPLPFLEAYKYLNHSTKDFPIAISKQERILSLPLYPELTKEQIEYICLNIKEFYYN